jgi:hypothetical protein
MSEDFQRLLADQNIECSMSRRGDCWGQRGDGEFLLNTEDRKDEP